MKVAAVIAEYNPFHTGHQYHLAQTRKLTGADYVLVIMSGNFVQRGAPALLDKYTRTRMALLGGADVVIELPALYATSSAEYFAQSGVALANRLGVVDILSFGSETGSLSPLMETASALLSYESQSQARLHTLLRQGFSYPAARQRAVAESLSPEMTGSTLSSPNNILGVEYCRALLASQSNITPFTLPRMGNGFHDHRLAEDPASYASASAIRSFIAKNRSASYAEQGEHDSLTELLHYVPAQCRNLFYDQICAGSYLFEDDLSLVMHYKLLSGQDQGFAQYLDCTPDLSSKIIKYLPDYSGFSDFCGLLKSKDITYSRISRMLLHILLGITPPAFYREAYSKRKFFLPYGRLLGFRKESTPLLASIKKNGTLPLITKLSDAQRELTGEALDFLNKEILYTSIYNAAAYNKNPQKKTAPNELRQSPVIIS